METLIIESYEYKKSEHLIKKDGHYLMLNDLIGVALDGSNGLNLGRDAKKSLLEIKGLGDRSAHNRRYLAKKSDLDLIRTNFRVCVEELLHISSLTPKQLNQN